MKTQMIRKTKLVLKLIVIGMTIITSKNSLADNMTSTTLSIAPLSTTALTVTPSAITAVPVPSSTTLPVPSSTELPVPPSTTTVQSIPPSGPVSSPVPTSVTPSPSAYDLQATPISIGYVVLNAAKGEVSLCKTPANIDPAMDSTETSLCWFIDTVYPSASGAALSSQPGSNTVLIANKDNGTIWACTFAFLPGSGSTQASGACTGISDMGHALPGANQPW